MVPTQTPEEPEDIHEGDQSVRFTQVVEGSLGLAKSIAGNLDPSRRHFMEWALVDPLARISFSGLS